MADPDQNWELEHKVPTIVEHLGGIQCQKIRIKRESKKNSTVGKT